MAATKRKTSGRTGSAKKNKKEMEAELEKRQQFCQEIVLWIIVALSLVLFVSNFGIGGVVGGFLSGVLFGVFGLLAYVFPPLLLICTFFAVSNKGNRFALVKLIAVILLTLFMETLFALFLTDAAKTTPVSAFTYGFEEKNGGGMIGGALAYILSNGFGTVGAYIVTVIGLIVSFVLLTGHLAMRGMKNKGEKVYQTAKEHYVERARERERRMDRKAEGFTIEDFTVGPAGEAGELKAVSSSRKKKRDRMTELTDDRKILPEDEVFAESGEPQREAEVTEEKVVRLSPQGMTEVVRIEQPAVVEPKITGFVNRGDSEIVEEQAGQEEELTLNERIGRGLLRELNRESQKIPVSEITLAEPVKTEEVPQQQDSEELRSVEEAETGSESGSTSSEDLQREAGQTLPGHSEEETDERTDSTVTDADEVVICPEPEPVREYVYPPVDLLQQPKNKGGGSSEDQLRETAMKLQQTLSTFGVNVTVTDISCGPSVTRYEIQPEMGVKVSKIVNLADDIKLNLAAADIRIEAPIPGKAAVGIEVPNKENVMVSFRELIESREFEESKSKISFAVGRDIGGKVKVADIAKMPHVLIAGATGSGKSVCINTIIMSILYKAKPDEVKLIMIDPKVVELSVYNGIPHLMIPVVTDPKKAAGALNWAVQEMTDRYNKFAETGVRKFEEYNAKIDKIDVPQGQERPQKMCQLVIIVDELADLMMVASHEVEEAICRLAQLARAAGIHLVIATQRPSVNVITGLIKANMPSRIAFAVTSGIDSRTILDMNGAEKLLGKGDMLFNPQGVPKPLRVQGAFVSDDEVSAVVDFLKENNGGASYSGDIQKKMESLETGQNTTVEIAEAEPDDGKDAYFAEAAQIIVDKEKASIGMLQRYLKVGFNRAARIMDQLEEAGIVGPEEGTKPRKVLMTPEEYQQFIDGSE